MTDHVETLERFPNIRALGDGCVSTDLDNWPRLKAEARALLEELRDWETLRPRILAMMVKRGWSTHWIHRSAYLHLEAAELAEAVRGKRGDPLAESGDVLITLLALSPHGLPEIVAAAEDKLRSLNNRPPYKGEEASAKPWGLSGNVRILSEEGGPER
ncbi:hypothetical protein LCGC14_2375110 [marine sediment metagenome]|uniref:Uncharacterized protein n=1 Tax=marine sediment metagenome TaxID=412755 RepID=A0A0F9EXA0_9ZZZZ